MPAPHTVAYTYDPLGRRVEKDVDGTRTNYLQDGDEEIAEYGVTGSTKTLLRRYIYGPSVDDRIAMVTASGTTTWYHTNHQGSTVAMTDSSGTVLPTEIYTYDEFGNSSSTNGQPFRYTGRRLDDETGLYYYRARYYSPTLGRFLQTDPIGYQDQMNLYAYVGNDPVNNTDPTGMIEYMGSYMNAINAPHVDQSTRDLQGEVDMAVSGILAAPTVAVVSPTAAVVVGAMELGWSLLDLAASLIAGDEEKALGQTAGMVTSTLVSEALDQTIGDGPADVVGDVAGKLVAPAFEAGAKATKEVVSAAEKVAADVENKINDKVMGHLGAP